MSAIPAGLGGQSLLVGLITGIAAGVAYWVGRGTSERELSEAKARMIFTVDWTDTGRVIVRSPFLVTQKEAQVLPGYRATFTPESVGDVPGGNTGRAE